MFRAPVKNQAAPPAESALRDLRPLWLVPTLLLCVVALFARPNAHSLWGAPFWVWWLCAVALSLPFFWLIHRRVETLAATLQARAVALSASRDELLASRDALAATAEENARLYEATRRHGEELRGLVRRIADVIGTSEDAGSVASVVVEQAMRLIACDGAGIFLLSEDRQTLLPASGIGASLYGRTLSLTESPLLPMILTARAPRVVTDLRTPGETGIWADAGMRALLAAPLRGNGAGTLGLLLLHWRSAEPPGIEDAALDVIGALASFGGVAVENARLSEAARASQQDLHEKNARLLSEARRRGDELQTVIRRVGDALAAGLSRARLSELVVAQAREMISCPQAAFAVCDAAGTFRSLADCHGLHDGAAAWNWDVGEFPFLRGVLERSHPVVIADVAQDGRLSARERTALRGLDIATMLLVPLRGRGERVNGLLSLFWTSQPYTPTPEEFSLAGILAAQGGAALENVRLYEDLEAAEAQTKARLAEATAARDFVERILQNVQAAVLVLSADDALTIQNANTLAEAMPDNDLQQDGLVGRRLADVLPGLDALLDEPLRLAVERGQSSSVTDTRYDGFARGTTYWTFSVTPQRDPVTRRVAQIVVMALETTDRLRLLRENEGNARRERLRANELEATLRSLSDGVALFDPSGSLVSVNRAGQAILGMDEPSVGARVEDWTMQVGLRYPDDSPVSAEQTPLAQTLQTGQSFERAEFCVRTRAGETRLIEMAATPVLGSDGTSGGAVAVFRDITEFKHAQTRETLANMRVETLVGVSRRLNATLDLDEIKITVCEGALALLPSLPDARACLFASDGEGRPLRAVAAAPADARDASAPLFVARSRLLRQVYAGRQPVVISELDRDPRCAAPAERALFDASAASALLIPLVARETTQGHLCLTSSLPGAFDDPRLRDALTNLAALAVVARANARLYSQMKQKADELDALWTIGQAVASKLALTDVVATLIERVRAVLGCEECSLWLFEPDSGALQAQGGKTSEEMRRVADEAARTGTATQADGADGQAILAMPLRYGKETLGALLIARAGGVMPEQIKLLGMLASLAVAVVRNARTFEHEHRIAETLQKSFLPLAPTVFGGLDIAEKYYATRLHEARIGGDYYDFLPLGPRRLAFMIGDISGKGLAAAVYTAMAKYTLRAFAAQEMPPQEVVARANLVLTRSTSGEVFSTLFFGIFDLDAQILTYVNAGHEPPQMVREDGSVTALDPTGPILGAIPDAEFAQAQIALTPGDTLALYTDGLSDARSPDGEFFGEAGIRAHLSAVRACGSGQIAAALHAAAFDFAQGSGIRDDIALLVIKVDK